MKITLSSVNHSASLSEETNAFTAIVNIDGVPAYRVKNNGQGGCHETVPLVFNGNFEKFRALEQSVEDYAATLPPLATSLKNKDGSPWMLQPDGDTVISEALEQHLLETKLRRSLAKSFVLSDGKHIYTVKKYPTDPVQEETLAKKYIVLNRLTFAEAAVLYKEGTK